MGIGETLISAKPCLQANCLRCASPNNCLSCNTTTFLSLQSCVAECPLGFYSHMPDRTCYVNCPVGFYGNLTNSQCTACPSQCMACSSATSCSSCSMGLFLLGRLCVSNCQTSTPGGSVKLYGDTASRVCKSCITPCDTCMASNGSFCNSCVLGYLFMNNCMIECPSDTYGTIDTSDSDSVKSICKSCDMMCRSCEITNTTCTSCQDGRSLTLSTCVSECPPNTFSTSNVCQACLPPCLTCSMMSCMSCIQGYLANGNCLNACPRGTYLSG